MRTWAFVSQKGGTGKTTLSSQIAVFAGTVGERVVMLDIDAPQYSLWKWHVARGEGTAPPVLQCPFPEKIMGVVAKIKASGVATLLILDTPPHSNAAAVEAIRACDLIVVPTSPSVLDLDSLQDTARLIAEAGATGRAVGVVNKVRGQGAVKSYAAASGFIEKFGIRVAAAYTGDRADFAHATDKGQGVTDTAKTSQAAKEIMALWGELNETPAIALAPMGSGK
jgi:chromosome partitioning protein